MAGDPISRARPYQVRALERGSGNGVGDGAPASTNGSAVAQQHAPRTAPPKADAPRETESLRWVLVRLAPLFGAFLITWLVSGTGGKPISDEGPFLAAARRLLHGHYALTSAMDGTKYLWHGPGLPALIAPLVAVGTPLTVIRLVGPVLLFVAVVVFYRLLRLRLSRRAALVGAYALGLYGPMYEGITSSLQKEPLALVMSVIALYGTAHYVMDGRRRYLALGGLALGGLAMTRLEYGWVLPALLAVAVIWWLVAGLRHGAASSRARTARRWSMVCGVGLLACVPWLAYTYSVTHHFFYWGNSGGISLYWMSSPASSQLGQWHASHTVFADPQLAAYRPLFHYLATLPPLQRDLTLRHLAIVQAEGHPAKYALNLLANLSRMLYGFPFSFTLSVGVLVGLALFNTALLGGLAATAVYVRRNRRSLPPEATPFVWFAALAFAVHLFPSAEPRFLIPLIPVPIWLMAHALNRRFGRSSAPNLTASMRRRAAPAGSGRAAHVMPR
ncbi:MAG TPA: glycosyltransferase family 39 protein [Solirubrobacteraceae bacterium]|nr:glycosyltransferase family 39 protein [Solirubrobacteraceae bacterium]